MVPAFKAELAKLALRVAEYFMIKDLTFEDLSLGQGQALYYMSCGKQRNPGVFCKKDWVGLSPIVFLVSLVSCIDLCSFLQACTSQVLSGCLCVCFPVP